MAKTTTTKKSNNAPTQEWGVIHIFGYGETQIIGDGINKKFPTTDLLKVQDVVDYIYSFKPESNTTSKEYHLINIFKNSRVSFLPKSDVAGQDNSFSVEYSDLDTTTIEALSAELWNKLTSEDTTSAEVTTETTL